MGRSNFECCLVEYLFSAISRIKLSTGPDNFTWDHSFPNFQIVFLSFLLHPCGYFVRKNTPFCKADCNKTRTKLQQSTYSVIQKMPKGGTFYPFLTFYDQKRKKADVLGQSHPFASRCFFGWKQAATFALSLGWNRKSRPRQKPSINP